METHHSSCEHLLGEVNVDFGSQEGPSGEPVQPHSSCWAPMGKPQRRILVFKQEMNSPPGLRLCEGNQEERKVGKTEQVPVLLSPSPLVCAQGLGCGRFVRELVILGISSPVLQRQNFR